MFVWFSFMKCDFLLIECSRKSESLVSNERRYFILSLPFTFQTSVLLVWCFSEYYYWIVVCSLVTWITNWDWIIQSIIFIINNPVSSSLLDSSYSISLTLIQCLLVRSVEILNLFVLVALVEDLYVWFMCLWKWWLSELFQKKGISMMSLLQTWLLKEISIDSHNSEMIITSMWSDIDLHYNTIDCQIDIIWNDINYIIHSIWLTTTHCSSNTYSISPSFTLFVIRIK